MTRTQLILFVLIGQVVSLLLGIGYLWPFIAAWAIWSAKREAR
jgi:hypothetical protein